MNSYYPATKGKWVVATSEYGVEFPALVSEKNVHGTQFHPEKSGEGRETDTAELPESGEEVESHLLELWAAIDLLSGSVVTLKQGKEEMKTTWEEKPVDVAARWEREGADGLHIIDLDAAFGKGSNSKTISTILERAKIPVEVGAG